MKTLTIVMCLSAIICSAQTNTDIFFEELESYTQQGVLSTSELSRIVKKNLSDFNQPMFTYGSDDQSEWELVSDYVLEFGDIGKPIGVMLDLNQDEHMDLVLSMNGGAEYTKIGIYLGKKNGFASVFISNGRFDRRYSNGDLSIIYPNCCDDPTVEFVRISIDSASLVKEVDALTICIDFPRDLKEDMVFSDSSWQTIRDPLHAITIENMESYAVFEPGAEIRVITKAIVQDKNVMFCEIKGEYEEMKYSSMKPHAFIWLGSDEDFEE